MRKGDVKNFSYRGSIEAYTIETSGLYKLEVRGACGGYSVGYKVLKRGTTIYVCCGGSNYPNGYFGSTHIALVNGTIAGIGKTNFDRYGLIVAGGGGGWWGSGAYSDGGGTNGGGGSRHIDDEYGARGWDVIGATQYGGGYGSQYGSRPVITGGGSFGQGNFKGGGGYYGGGYAYLEGEGSTYAGGSGGSGWIGGVPSITFKGITYNPSTQNGYNNDNNGSARLTLVEKKSNIKKGTKDITIYRGSHEAIGKRGIKDL